MCFVDIERAFDRVLSKVMEWAVRKKELLEVIMRTMMSLYCRAKPKFRVESEYFKKF